MNIMQIGDLHLGKIVNNYSMLNEQQFIIDQIEEIILSNQVNTLIITGDIFDRPIPNKEALELYDKLLLFLKGNNVNTFIINGNHDSETRIGYLSNILADSKIYISSSEKLFETIAIDNIRFHLVGYKRLEYINQLTNNKFATEMDAKKFIIDQIEIEPNCVNILVDHSFIQKANHQSLLSESERNLSLGGNEAIASSIYNQFDIVAAGHLHRHQYLSPNIFYSGSICPYSFSEATNKNGYYIHCINKQINSEYHHFKLLRKFSIIEDQIENIDNYETSDDYILFNILNQSQVINPLALLREKFPNIMQIEYNYIQNQSDVLISGKQSSISDMFKEFYEGATNNQITDEQLAYFLEIYNQIGVENVTD